MTKYCIPESLRYYYGGSKDSQHEEIDAIQTAILSLVGSLGQSSSGKRPKKEMFFSGMAGNQVWDSMRQFNSALLLAAQTRFDYIDLLFEIWNRTFKRAFEEVKWGDEEYCKYNLEHSISKIWNDGRVSMDIYRGGCPSPQRRRENLAIEENEVGELFLTVTRWKNDECKIDFDADFESNLWEVEAESHEDGIKRAVTSSGVKILELAKNFEGALAPAVEASREMIEFLKEN